MPQYQHHISLVSERKHARVTWAGIDLPALNYWVTRMCEESRWKAELHIKVVQLQKDTFSSSVGIVTALSKVETQV